ncbi:DUF4190 domain-containing protein [Actinoplanes sp. LDG1-01]|uniref:DUF4190 domain-containing protein n=1 Tax=Paractinoplanes lichenicola TaxID=2802976 RepID=A0ABS1VS95_9ACTN|nr:DUF4190 domain-containing protein [Actinoplanes lichenicola]
MTTFVAAPIGAVLGHVAVRKVRGTGLGGQSMARWAIVIGWSITVVYSLSTFLLVLWIVVRGITIYEFFTN